MSIRHSPFETRHFRRIGFRVGEARPGYGARKRLRRASGR